MRTGGSPEFLTIPFVWPIWTAGVLAFISTTVGFTLLGAWYDRWQGTTPKGVLVGIILGWTLGVYELYKVFKFLGEKEKKEPKDAAPKDKDRG